MSATGSRRILVTGLSSWWGGRVAQALERDPAVEALIGIDLEDPHHELDRTEFVRVSTDAALLRRIIAAAGIDTVLDTRLISDPLIASLSNVREVNVTGTRQLLEACGAPGSPVRRIVFKSSGHYYGCTSADPAFFGEEMARAAAPASAIERAVVEAERALAEFAVRSDAVSVAVVRPAEVFGGDPGASHLALLGLPVVPGILGFDPRLQFVHEEDAIDALAHVVRHELTGAYNVAADGVLALSEIASLLGKPMLPLLPPWGTGFAAAQLRRLGLRVPVEMIRLLRYGRALENRRLKASGFSYRYTTREAVQKLRAQQRLRPLLRSGERQYHYEREVEEFLRWSRSVQAVRAGRAAADGGGADGAGLPGFDALSATELIEIISSLELEDLARLREYEAAHRARAAVLEALDRNLARRREQG